MPRSSRSTRITLVTAVGSALAMVVSAGPAQASVDPVYPSAGEVQAAQSAVTSKKQQVEALQGRLNASYAQEQQVRKEAGEAAEKYNGARVELQQKRAAAKVASRKSREARQQAHTARTAVGELAAGIYRQGGSLGDLEMFLSDGGPQTVLDRAAGFAVVGKYRDRTLEQASASSQTAATLERQAARAQAQEAAAEMRAKQAKGEAEAKVAAVQSETRRLQSQQSAMVTELAQLRRTSVSKERQRQAGLRAEAERRAAEAARKRLEAQRRKAAALQRAKEEAAREAAAQKAREEAAARAAAQEKARERAAQEARAEAARRAESQRQQEAAARRAAAQKAREQKAADERAAAEREQAQAIPVSAPEPAPAPSGPASGASAAIAFARAQLGDRYVWAADGPSTWDCSGLTQGAWRAAGVYLPHQSKLQYNDTMRVPISELQPGDLVFYGSSPSTIYHVALYIGGDTIIEAPFAGGYVRTYSVFRYGDLLPYGGRVLS